MRPLMDGILGLRRWVLVLCALLLPFSWSNVYATDYPAKPIRLIVGWPAGGASDVIARVVAKGLSENMDQSVYVDDQPGAGGNIAANQAAKAKPDGYTILLATTSYGTNPSLYKHLPFHPIKSFAPVSMVAESAFSLEVNPSVPAKSVGQLLELAKSEPGKLNYGSQGPGSTAHLAFELFKAMTGAKIEMIPYNGGPPATRALIAGDIQVMFDSTITTFPLDKAGEVRILGVTTRKRLPQAPNIPAISETVPGYEVVTWFGVLAPAGTPKSVIARLHAGVAATLQQAEVRHRLSSLGAVATSSTPEELRRFIKGQISKWAKVVKAAGIKPR